MPKKKLIGHFTDDVVVFEALDSEFYERMKMNVNHSQTMHGFLWIETIEFSAHFGLNLMCLPSSEWIHLHKVKKKFVRKCWTIIHWIHQSRNEKLICIIIIIMKLTVDLRSLSKTVCIIFRSMGQHRHFNERIWIADQFSKKIEEKNSWAPQTTSTKNIF